MQIWLKDAQTTISREIKLTSKKVVKSQIRGTESLEKKLCARSAQLEHLVRGVLKLTDGRDEQSLANQIIYNLGSMCDVMKEVHQCLRLRLEQLQETLEKMAIEPPTGSARDFLTDLEDIPSIKDETDSKSRPPLLEEFLESTSGKTKSINKIYENEKTFENTFESMIYERYKKNEPVGDVTVPVKKLSAWSASTGCGSGILLIPNGSSGEKEDDEKTYFEHDDLKDGDNDENRHEEYRDILYKNTGHTIDDNYESHDYQTNHRCGQTNNLFDDKYYQATEKAKDDNNKKQDVELTIENDEETTNSQNNQYKNDNIFLDYPSEDDEENTESKSNQTDKTNVDKQNGSSDSVQKDIAPKKEEEGIGTRENIFLTKTMRAPQKKEMFLISLCRI